MLRRRLKSGFSRGLTWTGADAWIAAFRGVSRLPLILGYHRVIAQGDEASGLPGMAITRPTLERHLEWVGRRYRFASLDEIAARLEAEDSTEGLAAVTFDDGFNDVYENAFPMLVRKGIPAAVFVVSDVIGSPDPPLFERLHLALCGGFERWAHPANALASRLLRLGVAAPPAGPHATPATLTQSLLEELPLGALRVVVESLEEEVGRTDAPRLRPMSWAALQEMSESGVVIGSHTRSHAALTLECTPSAQDELKGSRDELEARLGRPVRHFAYPDGRWDNIATALVAAAGYGFGYTICGHRDGAQPHLTIPRRMLWEASCLDASERFSDAIMSCHAHGVFDFMARCRQRHTLPASAAA